MQGATQPIILSVSELTQAIKLHLEATFAKVWVKGEVSNLKLQSSGHLYFTLKDEQAQLPCACFRADLVKVPLAPKDGDQVLVRGEMSVWPPRGAYQLVVREISHVGRGEQLIKLEILKEKLRKLGYFAEERKRALPAFPKTIGIVTSPTGAVIQDILNILSRRMVGFHVILNPVRVQGEGADAEIAQAIDDFNRYRLADVLIVCRGGGSFEDLAPFNTERVATAIFKSEIPVVSAVGHETDFSVSDLVADLRAPTPSAAAEIISHEQEELLSSLSKTRRHISQCLQKKLQEARLGLLKLLRQPLFSNPEYFLRSRVQLLDELETSLNGALKLRLQRARLDVNRLQKSIELARPSTRILARKNDLLNLSRTLHQAIKRLVRLKGGELVTLNANLERRLTELLHLKRRSYSSFQFARHVPQLIQKLLSLKRRNLENVTRQLESLNPKRVLAQGYSIIFSQKDGSVISSIAACQEGQAVTIAFQDGQAEATITNLRVEKSNDKS